MVTIAAVAAGLAVDGAVRTEARGGTTVGGQDPNSASLSGDVQARASTPDGALRLGVAPSAVLAQSRQLFVRGFGEVDLRVGGTAWARLRQALGYGTIDLSPLAPAPGAGPVQPPPGSRFVSVQESNTSLELDVAASRRLQIVSSAAWVVAGGADQDARTSFPLYRGPQVRARLDWSASRLDTLRLELAAFDYRYSNERRASVASFTAGWRTQPSRGTELSLTLGPAVGRARSADQQATTLAYAAGAADFRVTVLRELSASIGTSVEPVGDLLSGEIVERAGARASVVFGRPGGVVTAARVIGSVALTSGAGGPTSPEAGDRYLQGEVSATVSLDAHSTFAAGARGAFLSRPLLGQPADQWAAFVAYAAQLPLLR